MYEDKTFENILLESLKEIDDSLDKRQGSIIFTALAPFAKRLAEFYKVREYERLQRSPLTKDRENLIKFGEIYNIKPFPATPVTIEAELIMDSETKTVPIGSRFSWEKINFFVTERISGNRYYLQSEETGEEGNEAFGLLIPIFNIAGLKSAEIIRVVINGEEEEETESLRERILDYLYFPSYGGNENQYINDWIKPIAGVGGVKIIRCPERKKGRVDVIITDSEYRKPSQELIDIVQNTLCPLGADGLPDAKISGVGVTPLGHEVLVRPVNERIIDVELNLMYENGYDFEQVKDEIKEKLEEYFVKKSEFWDSRLNLPERKTTEDTYIVISKTDIEYILHDVTGIVFYSDTKINGSDNIIGLEFDEIPVLGEITECQTN